jgi:hypothetical protein
MNYGEDPTLPTFIGEEPLYMLVLFINDKD